MYIFSDYIKYKAASRGFSLEQIEQILMTYFKEEDVLYLAISEGQETGSVEFYPNVTGELNDKGELIGIEILEASKFIRDYILETAQVKLLNLPVAMPRRRASEKVPQIAK